MKEASCLFIEGAIYFEISLMGMICDDLVFLVDGCTSKLNSFYFMITTPRNFEEIWRGRRIVNIQDGKMDNQRTT